MRYYLALLFFVTTAVAASGFPTSSTEICRPWESGWDRPLDPLADCRFDKSGERLTIRISGKGHELDFPHKRFNAPRLLRTVEGNFTVQVRVSGIFSASEESGEFRAGFFLTAGQDFSLKVVRVAVSEVVSEHEQTATAPFCVAFTNRDGDTWSFSAHKKKSADLRLELLPSTQFAQPPFLRLERRGKTLRVAVGENGQDWVPMQAPFRWLKEIELPREVKLGVVAESTASGSFDAQFDEFKIRPF